MKSEDEDKPYCIPFACPDGVVGHICYTSYSAAIDEAERRRKLGQNQIFCWSCGLWLWPDEKTCDHTEISTETEFRKIQRNFEARCKRQEGKGEREYIKELKRAGIIKDDSEAYFTDPQGRRVRKYHKVIGGSHEA